jgi:MFS family permease
LKKDHLLISAVSLGLGMVFTDLTAVSVALPTIGKAFGASMTQLHWIMNAMVLGMASCVLAAGRIGDMWGHQKTFAAGVSGFTIASLIAAITPSIDLLIAARALQGMTAVGMTVSASNIVMTHIVKEKQGAMLGLIMGLASVFLIIGPFIGGLLLSIASWRWIFAINLPFAVMVLLCCQGIPTPPSSALPHKNPWDWQGFILVACLLTSVTIGIMQFKNNVMTYTLLSAALLSGYTLLHVESKKISPFLDFALFKKPGFGINCSILFFAQALFFNSILWNIYFQSYLHFSPFITGLINVPFGALVILSSTLSGKIYDRFGFRRPLQGGVALVALGFVQLAIFLPSSPLIALLIACGCLNFGIPLIANPIRTHALQQAAPQNKGFTNAMLSLCRQTGGLLGLALLSFLQTAGIHVATQQGLNNHSAYFQGFHWSMIGSAAIAVLALILSFRITENSTGP